VDDPWTAAVGDDFIFVLFLSDFAPALFQQMLYVGAVGGRSLIY
jgi:hypothetical protein